MDLETDDQKKMRLVQAELIRMRLLPHSSAYAVHRLRVLNKMTQLLSVDPEVTVLIPNAFHLSPCLFPSREPLQKSDVHCSVSRLT